MLIKVYLERTSITLRIDIHKKNQESFIFTKKEKHNLHKALTLGGFSRVEEKKIIYVF